jgi:hypothetical protein
MKPEIKAEWLEELTKHKQAKDVLRNEEGMCCLGVLCEVASRHTIGTWEKHEKGYDHQFSFSCELEDVESLILPDAVRTWADIDTSGYMPFQDKQNQQMSLAVANDFGCTFAQISDLIKHFF